MHRAETLANNRYISITEPHPPSTYLVCPQKLQVSVREPLLTGLAAWLRSGTAEGSATGGLPAHQQLHDAEHFRGHPESGKDMPERSSKFLVHTILMGDCL
eukprot:scaffold123478_cov18-Tisochrysis_lutea.AAC.3